MTSPQSLLPIAKEAQNLARTAGPEAVVFQKVAAVSMCVVAVAAGMHVLMQLWHDLHEVERHSGHDR